MMNEKELEIYRKYQNVIAPFIVELEVRDNEYPVEILNEIRAIFTHLSRYKIQNEEKDLSSAEKHVKRAILDCYKYLCISIMEKIDRFRTSYKSVDFSYADNGTFLPKLDKLESFAQADFKAAKKAEIAKSPEEEQYKLFEKAYNAYSLVDKHLEDSREAILFASNHTKKSNRINIISCIVSIISIGVAIVSFFV